MIPHFDSLNDIEKELQTNFDRGLSQEECVKRQQTYGKNKLDEKKKKTLFARLLEQFADVMIIILLIAAAISLSVAIYEGVTHGFNIIEMIEPFLILAIVLINAIMGVVQESKAERR